MKENCFSIIICAHNEAKTIKAKIKNSLAIRGNIVEIIIINDYSDDQTEEIIKDFMTKHSNIHLFDNKYQKGKAGSLLTGVENARGDWLILTDADVLIAKNAIINLLPYTQAKNVSIICGRAKGRSIGWEIIEHLRRYIFPAWLSRGQLMIVRNQLSLFQHFDYLDDVEIALKAVKNKGRIIFSSTSHFYDSFHSGLNFFYQFWRRLLVMNKALLKNFFFFFNIHYFSFIEILNNLFFFFFCYLFPIIFILFIIFSIHYYWPLTIFYLMFYQIVIMAVLMSFAGIYSFFTLNQKSDFNWPRIRE